LYEATLTAALATHGVAPEQGLTLAVLAHALKFGYAYVAGLVLAAVWIRSPRPARWLARAELLREPLKG
jgi:hypothetical protein